MKIITVAVTLFLTGCGTYGEPLILSRWYDSFDQCQLKNNHGQYPSWCGASGVRTHSVTTITGQTQGYIVKRTP